jgi:hypothetical protein
MKKASVEARVTREVQVRTKKLRFDSSQFRDVLKNRGGEKRRRRGRRQQRRRVLMHVRVLMLMMVHLGAKIRRWTQITNCDISVLGR